ncbi:hypothetical protein GCM10023339_46630 [Alloalcanivorax gelatiniphagus]
MSLNDGLTEAFGGAPGGIGTAKGEQVIVRLDAGVLAVFTSTDTYHFHIAMIERFDLVPHPGITGWMLEVRGPRAIGVPVTFEGEQLRALRVMVDAVRRAR